MEMRTRPVLYRYDDFAETVERIQCEECDVILVCFGAIHRNFSLSPLYGTFDHYKTTFRITPQAEFIITIYGVRHLEYYQFRDCRLVYCLYYILQNLIVCSLVRCAEFSSRHRYTIENSSCR